MSAELLIASESLEMPTSRSGTFYVRELGEVAIPAAKANSMLAAVLWIGIGMFLQLMPRREDFGTVIAFG
jgi:hypothetical protein